MTRDRDLRLLGWVALAYALVSVAAIVWLDDPLARWVATRAKPAIARDAIHYLEVVTLLDTWKYAQQAVLVALALAVMFAPPLRGLAPQVTYVVIVQLLARNLMLWSKGITGRLRPLEWLHDGGPSFFAHGISFPSGHVVLFAGLAIPIALAWPRAWPVLAVIPIAMAARISVDAHFASDTLSAVALVCFVAWACAPLLTTRARPDADADDPQLATAR